MANYSYLARDDAGKQVKGVMAAENELDLANRLHNLGYFLTSVKNAPDVSKRMRRRAATLAR